MNDSWQTDYAAATRLAQDRDYAAAREAYVTLRSRMVDVKRLALVTSDLGTLEVLGGNRNNAMQHFVAALHLDGSCQAAIDNLRLLQNGDDQTPNTRTGRTKVAIVSFLFNWPSTGGGIVHTVELAEFLKRAGFDVKLFGVRYAPWGIGRVDACPFPVDVLSFERQEWSLASIKTKLRAAVKAFAPDAAIVTDAWNIKPHLIEALDGYRVFLRMQAQECLCPLNNLRLLSTSAGATQCANEQLSGPEACRQCLVKNAATSGELHRLERELSGVDGRDYHARLLTSLKAAEAVLVLNPTIAQTLRPYCRRVAVVTWGMDPERFPVPGIETKSRSGPAKILFAGLTREFIKGFHVLREACAQLWETRQDFELIVTDDPRPNPEPFARYVGWQSQQALPQLYRATDITVVPTIVQDGLSRTSVEAMASGRPVVASRIGGIPFTVSDGETGLLFEPGNAGDLAGKLNQMLDDRKRRNQMGKSGRRVFEERFSWPEVVQRSYVPLLGAPVSPTVERTGK